MKTYHSMGEALPSLIKGAYHVRIVREILFELYHLEQLLICGEQESVVIILETTQDAHAAEETYHLHAYAPEVQEQIQADRLLQTANFGRMKKFHRFSLDRTRRPCYTETVIRQPKISRWRGIPRFSAEAGLTLWRKVGSETSLKTHQIGPKTPHFRRKIIELEGSEASRVPPFLSPPTTGA